MSLLNINNIYRYLTGKGNELKEPKDEDLIAIARSSQGNFLTKGIRFKNLKNAILKSISIDGGGPITKKSVYKITGGDSFVVKELISGEDVFDWSLTNTSTRRMVVTYTGSGSLVANSGTIELTPTNYQNEGWGGFVAFPMPIKVELASTSVQLLIGGWAFNGGATLVQAFPLLSRNDEFTQFYILEITYQD